jgi:hypothetical protein
MVTATPLAFHALAGVSNETHLFCPGYSICEPGRHWQQCCVHLAGISSLWSGVKLQLYRNEAYKRGSHHLR